MNKLTKIVMTHCQDCNRKITVLCSEDSYIIAARCPECNDAFLRGVQQYNEEGWTDPHIEPVAAISRIIDSDKTSEQ